MATPFHYQHVHHIHSVKETHVDDTRDEIDGQLKSAEAHGLHSLLHGERWTTLLLWSSVIPRVLHVGARPHLLLVSRKQVLLGAQADVLYVKKQTNKQKSEYCHRL